MSDIKPAEVSAILKKQLADVSLETHLEEVGTVLTVGDGIARVYGLNNAQSGEHHQRRRHRQAHTPHCLAARG